MTPPRTLPHVVTPGAVLDRIALLEVKDALLRREENRRQVAMERPMLAAAWTDVGLPPPQSFGPYPDLRRIHRTLWALEDAARDAERRREFGMDFVDLVCRIQGLNADRAATRRAVDSLVGTEHGIQLLDPPSGYDSYADQIAIGEVRTKRRPGADPESHEVLRELWLAHGLPDIFATETFNRLRLANDRVWCVKDRINAEWAAGRPSVQTCRSLYLVNDARVRIKRHIAVTLRSALCDVKEYVQYGVPDHWDGDALAWRDDSRPESV